MTTDSIDTPRGTASGIDADARIAIDATTSPDEAAAITEAWVTEHVPAAWRDAAGGGAAAIRLVELQQPDS